MTNNALTVPTRTRRQADLLTADFWEDMGLPQLKTSVADSFEDVARPAHTAVLEISAMPSELRQTVESAMVVCIPSPSELSGSNKDPLTAHWFTAWRRDPFELGLTECREVITGTQQELNKLRDMLENLADEHMFEVELRIVD
ncbi:hypothetical protein CDES_10220 [Corynebacterium deserti GIMN1.010]|uniref:Uncharacterized protein n=1 Tax=Corynebacterium deserti GIMN1.010 TaxID=931089 RepID=A0A0M4CYD0_9CORY|nr:hypothetical protein [Corynebacterium deserti]ALC06425.1 hypothetical protein CDES_10220 [Corynebacterium deserti GIMN1.010]